MTVLGGQNATLFDRLLVREVPEADVVLRGRGKNLFPNSAKLCK